MNKKILSALLSALLLFSVSLSFSACEKEPTKQSDVEKYSYLTFETDEKSECATVVGYNRKTIPDELAIPSKIDGYLVSAIGEYAFSDCKTVVSVTIPDSVETIGKGAFGGCTSLASVTLSKNIEKIPSFAFFGCAFLKEVNVPEKVTLIENGAFLQCKQLIRVTFPKGLKKISQAAFADCIDLSADVPSDTEIETDAFGCDCLDDAHVGRGSLIIDDSLKVYKNSFGAYSTVFTSFESAPSSWYFYDYSQITPRLKETWKNDGSFVYYGCTFATAVAGEKYVYSVPVAQFSITSPIKKEYCSIPNSKVNPAKPASPYRDGYKFLGWSKTEGKNAPDYTFLSRKTVFDVQNGRVVVIGTAPGSDDEEVILFGTTLYTVWEKSSD